MEIYIDDCLVDTEMNTSLVMNISSGCITDIDSGGEDQVFEFVLPVTERNVKIMGDVQAVDGVKRYNREVHVARIECDGVPLIKGDVHLSAVNLSGNGGGCYRIEVFKRGYEWVKQASKAKFKDIPIEFKETIYDNTIWESWTWDKPVRWLPVLRDTLKITSSTGIAPMKFMTARDYHPFLHIRTLMEKIAEAAGYEIRSDFMESEEFDSLYMSGRYHDKNIEPYKARMDFLAGRREKVSAQADVLGQVYADPLNPNNSIGAIVDTATPIDDRADRVDYDFYTVNGCFVMENGRAMFKTVEPVECCFEYKLKYTTDYRVKDRESLCGFDTITLDDLIPVKYKLTNPFVDRKEEIQTPYAYRVVVFDEKDDSVTAFRVTGNVYSEDGNVMSENVTLLEFEGRTGSLGTTEYQGKRLKDLKLTYDNGSGAYVDYGKDWAVYDLVSSLSGTMVVAVTIRSRAQRLLPSEPKYFDLICFGGAEEGMTFTLDESVTVKPIFCPQPLVGSTVDFEDVATTEMYQIDLFRAMQHMFNLYMFTDTENKVIVIEPRDRFFRNDMTVDWTTKTDMSVPVEIRDMEEHDMTTNTVYRYMPEDGAVMRWDESNNEIFGQWKVALQSRFIKTRTHEEMNGVFSPTINKDDELTSAPSASLPQVGDRDRSGVVIEVEDLNFPAKVVRYKGMMPLEGAEVWGWPTFAKEYPLSAFHFKKRQEIQDQNQAEEFTLCFEDRDNLAGQHRYYDSWIKSIDNDKIVTLNVYLQPGDVEPLIVPNGLARDFRARYKISVDSETIYVRLLRIENYDPLKYSARCVFLKENAAV